MEDTRGDCLEDELLSLERWSEDETDPFPDSGVTVLILFPIRGCDRLVDRLAQTFGFLNGEKVNREMLH